MEENELRFLRFSRKCDELAKRAFSAKLVHKYSLNIRILRRTL